MRSVTARLLVVLCLGISGRAIAQLPPPPAELCTDGMDNDGDGRVDCYDTDCPPDPRCPERESAEPSEPPPPPTETDCSDRFDNDRDAATDCADPDCLLMCPPPPEGAVPPPTEGGGLFPPPPPSDAVNVKTYGAVCDGIADDTVAIQNAADAAAGKTLYFPKGVCRVTGIEISARTTVIGDGPANSVLKMLPLPAGNDGHMPILEIMGDAVSIAWMQLDGNRLEQTEESFADAYNNYVGGAFREKEGCGNGVQVLHGRGKGYRSGIRAECVSGLTIKNCELTNTFGAAVATLDSSDIVIRNVYAHDTNFELAFIYGTNGTNPSTVSGSHITITNNRMKDIGVETKCSPVCAEADAILLSRADTAEIAYNTLEGFVDRCLVKVEGSKNVHVHHNNAEGGLTEYPGIQVQTQWHSSENIVIEGNTIVGSGFGNGVQINASDTETATAKNITVRANTLEGMSWDGVVMDGKKGLSNILVENNTLRRITRIPVYVNGGGTGLEVQGNTIDGEPVEDVLYPDSFEGPFLIY